MATVTLKGIKKAFGANPIVKGVDLEVQSGEFLVMLGPSGCGKTTLLRLIAGLEQLDEGELSFDGRPMANVPPRDRDVGMVFQAYALYPHMTVRENLGFGLSLREVAQSEIDQRVNEAAQMLALTELLDRKPKEMSGGQKQRVAIGRVIVRRPKVFLFDEPLSNLDTALRVQMRGELAALHQRLKVTMIYVTHDQVEAMTLATRVAVFNQGKLQQLGPPLTLYNQPANTFVATFLGSPSMNLLKAKRDGATLSGDGFTLDAPADLSQGGDLLLGLRPQDLRVAPDGPLKGTVKAVERLGFDGFVFAQTPAGEVTARFEGGAVNVGDTVQMKPVADALHVFTADGASALRHPPPRSQA
ncbi:MAG: ABC transporter ATP-binding protein [Myxococcaceae bacterium]